MARFPCEYPFCLRLSRAPPPPRLCCEFLRALACESARSSTTDPAHSLAVFLPLMASFGLCVRRWFYHGPCAYTSPQASIHGGIVRMLCGGTDPAPGPPYYSNSRSLFYTQRGVSIVHRHRLRHPSRSAAGPSIASLRLSSRRRPAYSLFSI